MHPSNNAPGRSEDDESSVVDQLGAVLRSLVPSSDGHQTDESGRSQRSTPESDEDYVRLILDSNDGRVKQATVAQKTGWSDAKVSRLLCQMEDAGEIERYRIGREKVVTLPDNSR